MTADGAVFSGEAAGAAVPVATGELVFNTAMSGYQEVITDPSYAGQVISFTSTHIGNYGTNAADAVTPETRSMPSVPAAAAAAARCSASGAVPNAQGTAPATRT